MYPTRTGHYTFRFILFTVVLGCMTNLVISVQSPTETYNHSLKLMHGNAYNLYWKYSQDEITFEVHVKTTGYIGFGVSADGSMKHADIVIGWVKERRIFFHVSRVSIVGWH